MPSQKGVIVKVLGELESPPCPLCGGGAFRPVIDAACDRITGKRGTFQVQACAGCGLVVTRPRPTAAALAYYYEGAYSSSTGTHCVEAIQTRWWLRWITGYRLRVVERAHPLGPGQRLLDVGCGYGAFLSRARRETGCEATGVDTDAGSIARALDRDLIDYRCGSMENVGLEPGQFDVITFFESLEHHLDPVAALKAARTLLKPGGVCVVEVPNFDGVWRRVFRSWWMPLLVPQHVVHFTPATLRQALRAAGFEVIGPHRAMFYPLESTASLGLWLNRVLGRPIRGYRLRWTRPDGALLLLVLFIWWLVIELPTQDLFAATGLTGHQLMVATPR